MRCCTALRARRRTHPLVLRAVVVLEFFCLHALPRGLDPPGIFRASGGRGGPESVSFCLLFVCTCAA
jgi:hypothetical protein